MAFYDNLFGTTPPDYLTGLLGSDGADALQQKANSTGLLNMALGYLVAPKHSNLGLGHILASSYMAGQQGAQGTYDNALNNYLTQDKIDEIKRRKANELGLQNAMSQYGKPNSTTTAPSTVENVPAPQNTDSPNFNTVQQTTPGATTQSFDKSKWLSSAIPYLDPKEAIAMLSKQGTITWQDTGNGLVQLSDGQPTGVMLPKGVSPADLLHARTTMYTHDNQSADNIATNATSANNNAASTSATIYGHNLTHQDEMKKLDPWGVTQTTPHPNFNATTPKVATLQDIADTAKASGKTTAQVTADLKKQGYKIQGSDK